MSAGKPTRYATLRDYARGQANVLSLYGLYVCKRGHASLNFTPPYRYAVADDQGPATPDGIVHLAETSNGDKTIRHVLSNKKHVQEIVLACCEKTGISVDEARAEGGRNHAAFAVGGQPADPSTMTYRSMQVDDVMRALGLMKTESTKGLDAAGLKELGNAISKEAKKPAVVIVDDPRDVSVKAKLREYTKGFLHEGAPVMTVLLVAAHQPTTILLETPRWGGCMDPCLASVLGDPTGQKSLFEDWETHPVGAILKGTTPDRSGKQIITDPLGWILYITNNPRFDYTFYKRNQRVQTATYGAAETDPVTGPLEELLTELLDRTGGWYLAAGLTSERSYRGTVPVSQFVASLKKCLDFAVEYKDSEGSNFLNSYNDRFLPEYRTACKWLYRIFYDCLKKTEVASEDNKTIWTLIQEKDSGNKFVRSTNECQALLQRHLRLSSDLRPETKRGLQWHGHVADMVLKSVGDSNRKLTRPEVAAVAKRPRDVETDEEGEGDKTPPGPKGSVSKSVWRPVLSKWQGPGKVLTKNKDENTPLDTRKEGGDLEHVKNGSYKVKEEVYQTMSEAQQAALKKFYREHGAPKNKK